MLVKRRRAHNQDSGRGRGGEPALARSAPHRASPGRTSRGNIGLLSGVLKYTGRSPRTYRTERSSVLLVKLDFIVTKAGLCQFLCDTISIDAEILMGGDLENITVAQRTSWAYRRKTSGIEDIAIVLAFSTLTSRGSAVRGSQAFRLANRQLPSPVDSRLSFLPTVPSPFSRFLMGCSLMIRSCPSSPSSSPRHAGQSGHLGCFDSSWKRDPMCHFFSH